MCDAGCNTVETPSTPEEIAAVEKRQAEIFDEHSRRPEPFDLDEFQQKP